MAAIAAHLEIAAESSLVGTINTAWSVLFGGMPPTQDGLVTAVNKLEEALRWCSELGVHGVTVYAFSIENFKRSAEEVAALMALTEEKLRAMSDEQMQRLEVQMRDVTTRLRATEEELATSREWQRGRRSTRSAGASSGRTARGPRSCLPSR